ncbi:MAG: hypothetical protein QW470_06225 [Candidatus Caldarchaeum sp.]
MRYVSIRDVRVYNGWQPIEAIRQPLRRIDETNYRTPHRPLVDADWDGTIIDDVETYLDGEIIEPEAIDPDQGIISIYPPPSENARVEASYSWHPVGDGEITLAVEAAEAEVEALTGTIYAPHPRIERITLHRGSLINLSEPALNLLSVRIYDSAGNLVMDNADADILDHQAGLVRLRHSAGEPRPPWYLSHPLTVEVVYQAGYQQPPPTVRQAILTLASYWVLTRFQRSLSFAADYGGAVVAGFTSEELESRLRQLREKVENVKRALPRRVGRA